MKFPYDAQECDENGYRRFEFSFAGKKAVLTVKDSENFPKKLLFKPEYYGAFPAMQRAFLDRGYAVAHLTNNGRWVREDDLEDQIVFLEELVNVFGFTVCVALGMSCGGLQALRLAAAVPNRFNALILDAPVVDLLSCPFNRYASHPDWPEAVAELHAYFGKKIPEDDGIPQTRDRILDALRSHPLPIFLIAGDSDTVVPFEENGRFVERVAKDTGAPFRLILKAGCNHHPHGIDRPEEAVEFAETYACP